MTRYPSVRPPSSDARRVVARIAAARTNGARLSGPARLAALLAVLLLVLAGPARAWAAAGDLDSGFGTGGTATTDFSGNDSSADFANATAVQSDGKVIAVGSTSASGGPNRFALARYNSDGTPDSGFGSGGMVTTAFGGATDSDTAYAVALQSDGKIVVAGRSSDHGVALARYNTDGTLDPTFNPTGATPGTVTTAFGGTAPPAEAKGVAIEPSGEIVIAGDGASGLIVAGYTTVGTLDPAFGTVGVTTFDFGNPSGDAANAVAIQPAGTNGSTVDIVVAGSATSKDFSQSSFALARFTSSGSRDTTFGTGASGKVTTTFSGNPTNTAYALAIQPSDNRIVAAGSTTTSGGATTFALARYNTNGSLDTTFGTGGSGEVTTLFNNSDIAYGVALQPDGQIVAAGATTPRNGHNIFALARYNAADGSLDTGFGMGGKVTTDVGGGGNGATGVAVGGGRIVAAGAGAPSGARNPHVVVARYQLAAAPTVTMNPTDQTVTNGQMVTFSAAASGNPTPTVQWQYSTNGGSFMNCPDAVACPTASATSPTLSFTADSAQNGNQYRAVFTNEGGSALSMPAVLTVNTPLPTPEAPTGELVGAGLVIVAGASLLRRRTHRRANSPGSASR